MTKSLAKNYIHRLVTFISRIGIKKVLQATLLFFLVASLSTGLFLSQRSQDLRQQASTLSCGAISTSNCESVPGCSLEDITTTCKMTDCKANKNGCVYTAAQTQPCTLANYQQHPNECTYIAAQTASCASLTNQGAAVCEAASKGKCSWSDTRKTTYCSLGNCPRDKCSYTAEQTRSCTMTECKAGKSGCDYTSEISRPCTEIDWEQGNSNCSRKLKSSATPAYCSGASGCSSFTNSFECKQLGCSWTDAKPATYVIEGRIVTRSESCGGRVTTAAAKCTGSYSSGSTACSGPDYVVTPASVRGTITTVAEKCEGSYISGKKCTGTPRQVTNPPISPSPSPKNVALPKDCSFAKHGEYSCSSLTECVQCNDGTAVPASREKCAEQNPSALCKPSSNTKDCGWADHGEHACKSITECVRCENGQMQSTGRSQCEGLPCGITLEEPEIKPGAACSEVTQRTCTVNGKVGSQSCLFTQRSSLSPYDCNQNPTNCDDCVIEITAITPSPTPASCGRVGLSCCRATTACTDGSICNESNRICEAKKTDTPYPGGSCSEISKRTCTFYKEGQQTQGSQTCTFTQRDYSSPYSCNQNPTNCSQCTDGIVAPGQQCSTIGFESCTTTSGALGTKSCTYTQRSSSYPYECNLSPKNCGECTVNQSIAGAQCNEERSISCTVTDLTGNVLPGTKTCTFTKRSNTDPFACTLEPENCGACYPTQNQCEGLNLPTCWNQGIVSCVNGVVRTTAYCSIACINNSCCGDSGQSCCPGSNPCGDGLSCTNNICTATPPQIPISPPKRSLNIEKSCGTNGVQLCSCSDLISEEPYMCAPSAEVCSPCQSTTPEEEIVQQNDCNPQRDTPYCANSLELFFCAEGVNEWIGITCNTSCGSSESEKTSHCLSPAEYQLAQMIYNQNKNQIQEAEIQAIYDNPEELSVVALTGSLP